MCWLRIDRSAQHVAPLPIVVLVGEPDAGRAIGDDVNMSRGAEASTCGQCWRIMNRTVRSMSSALRRSADVLPVVHQISTAMATYSSASRQATKVRMRRVMRRIAPRSR